MRRYLFVILSFILCYQLHARERYDINRGWKFFPYSEVSSDGAVEVNLPHMWNNDALGGKRDYLRGIGNYIKELHIPFSWSGKRIFIKCYGANTVSNVIVNGKHVGEHRAGYSAFAYEITDQIVFGRDNSIRIIVNNSPQMDVLPIAGDATSYGGIFRNVELIVTGSDIVALTDMGADGVYIKQGAVSRERADAEAIVKITGTGDNTVTARILVHTPSGDTVARGETKVRLSGRAVSTARIPFTVTNPRLWNGTDDPFMYDVTVSVVSSGKVTDQVTVSTGLRTVGCDPVRGFLLNGSPYKVRGTVIHQDRAISGNALTEFQIHEDFDLLREMGANAVRVAGVMHHPEFYSLCDREGILLWSDLPLVGATYMTDRSFIDTESFRTNGRRQLEEMIYQLYNHPSVVIWGIFSELDRRGDDPLDYIIELNSLAKREGGGRLTGATSNDDGEINFVTDVICWNHILGWKEGQPSDIDIWRRQLHSSWPNLRSAVSYSAGGSIFQQQGRLERPDWMGNWHPENWQTHFHEEYFRHLENDSLLWGIFPANLFDYGAAGRNWGEGGGINDSGLVTFDRKYRKDAYYLYKANWNHDDPFVYITSRRRDRRRSRMHDIKIYSNCYQVELLVNGVSEGTKTGKQGRFVWNDIEFSSGTNFVEARSGGHSDRVVIEILSERAPARFDPGELPH